MASFDGHELPAFKLERFFAEYEFVAPHLLCCSDCEPLAMSEVLQLADPETMQMWNDLRLGYTETAGLPALREEVRKAYLGISPDDVTILAPEEGVYLTMRALLKPGDHVICTFPGYQSLYSIAQALGCHVHMWEPEPLMPGGESSGMSGSGPETGTRFDVERLLAMLASPRRPVSRLVVVNFPHNPSGFLPSQDEWQRLVTGCKEHGSYLFSDEMYRGLELEPSRRLPAACDLYDRGISLGGVSKTLGLPGLRIGWVASRADIEEAHAAAGSEPRSLQTRLRELKDYTTICCSAPSEVLALIALKASAEITSRHLSRIVTNLKHAGAFFTEFSHLFEWRPPLAGSVCFPRLITGEPVDLFCERVVKGCGVLLLPSTVYDHAGSITAGHFRIGLGRANAPDCLERLGGFLRLDARGADSSKS